MSLKIYFAGSIRGGRNDAALYNEFIRYLSLSGRVLTEHVGDLSRSVYEQAEDRERQIYLQDTGWLKECDVIIAECTSPSLGVGYELAYAESLGKPAYILYRPKQANLSAMLKGDDYFRIFPYETKEEAFAILDGIVAECRKQAR